MLDGRFKHSQDKFWDRCGKLVARTGVSANQVTVLGTIALLVNCAAYLWHENAVAFGVAIALLELTDNLDGAVARVTGTSSSFGAYLDAVTDRYKEVASLAAIGWVTGQWALAFACISGALLTSYNKARAGMEQKISNVAWPDLFERLERLIVLCASLILSPFSIAGHSMLTILLVVFALGSHLSALQRLVRARSILGQ